MKNQPQIFESESFAAWVSGTCQAMPSTFCGVTQNSRGVWAGCLYVALRGERFDGHDFVAQALRAGAAAALVETSWKAPAELLNGPLIRVPDTRQALSAAARAWREQSRARIVGVTGSSGKTTTKEMTAALLGAGGTVCATQGNLNNEVGLPLSLLTLPRETDFGVFELGSNHPGEIARLTDVLRPQAGIVASVGCAHIEYFGTQEAIAREKGALLRALPPDGFAAVCRETACFETLTDGVRARLVTTSLQTRDADFYGEMPDPLDGSLRVTERGAERPVVLCSGLPGAHNASNLLLAFAAARAEGVPADAAVRALQGFVLPGMRWAVSERGGVKIVNDAYNANPQSMMAVLKTFMTLPCAGRRIAVLGDMLELGRQSEALHRDVGRCVAALAPDRLIAVGSDTSQYVIDEAVRGGYAISRVTCCQDAAAAAAAFRECVKPGDNVLLKASRGMRLEQILDGWEI